MDLSRYRDKSYLVSYELTTDIFDSYDLAVEDIVPVRSVYILYTNKGIKILKKVDYGIEDLEFINIVINYIYENGYKYVVPFMKTIGGMYHIKRNDGIYVMLDLVEGREASFENPVDISNLSKALCSMHLSTRGIDSILEKRNRLYSWPVLFGKRTQNLLKFKEIAEMHEIKSEFDKVFLEYVDNYYSDALKSFKLINDLPYNEMCSMAYEQKNICHHDLAYHNILLDNDNKVYFVDFDYCILDLRIHDIANLIAKSIKHCNWDTEKARLILKSYSSIDKLEQVELKLLHAFLTFPQDFYEISSQYYMKTKNWDEDVFLSRLIRKSGYLEDRREFLYNMSNMI